MITISLLRLRPSYVANIIGELWGGWVQFYSWMKTKKIQLKEHIRPWSDLQIEMLELILSNLSGSDYASFLSVCKSWSCAPKIYCVNRSPLLLYYKNIDKIGKCHYYNPCSNMAFEVDCPSHDLSNCMFYYGRDGWLLTYNNYEIMLLNPFSGDSHKFPGLEEDTHFSAAAFSGCPDSNECTIFLISSFIDYFVSIYLYDQKEGWHHPRRGQNGFPFLLAPSSNPVFCHGLFYCLGEDGNIGVFNPRRKGWRICDADKLKQFDNSRMDGYLVESKGEIMAVQIGNYGNPIHVYLLRLPLDFELMVWEEIYSLDEQSLFVGSPMSILTTPLDKKLCNKLFVPRFFGEHEAIAVDVDKSNGKLYFKEKLMSSYKGNGNGKGKNKRKDEFEICCYSFLHAECPEYYGSSEKLYSIWFEPKINDL